MANKDILIKMFEGIRDERTKHANTARRIGNAFLSMLDFASSAGDGKLSSVHDDIAQGFITFVKGLMSNQLAQLKGGASFGSDGSYSFDKDGNLVIESAHSRDFDEMLQNGFALKRNPTSGKYTLSISDLIVWGRMVINTLETRKKYAIGGNVYLSGASSKIQHVEKVYSEDGETVVGYKCYILKDDGTMATQNGWVVGDQALCQTFDIEEGVYQNVSNQYYWRLVTQVSDENVAITEKYIDKDGNEQIRELYEGQKFAWVVLSKDDCDTNSGIPASGDTIVMDGHRLTENEDIDYTERTNVLMLEATGSGSPRIIALTGIVDYKHDTDNEVFILSPQKVIFTTEHFEIRTASGAPITFVHFMGPWVEGTEYHYYDQVSHANALWTCIVEKGKSTTDEPTDGNVYWRKEMSGGKGEKGDDAVIYTLEASPGYIRLSSDGSIDYTNGYINKGDEYGSDKYLVVRGYKVVKGVRDNRFSTEASPVTLRLTINDGNAYSEYTPYDGDSVSIDFEPKYEDSYYSILEEISHSGLNSVRVDMCEGSEYDPNKILATCDIPIIQNGKGEGVVMAYKNATYRPEPPVTEDLSLLTDGWSRTPQKGGSYEKVSNVSYGNYSVGNTESGYSTSEWSEVSDSGETWRKSPAGLSNNGWALMKVSFTTNVDNADVRVVIKAYSETNFDFIQVHELDKEVTGSTSLRKNGVVYTSGNGVEGTYSFTSVGAGQHFFYVSYCKDSSQNANGDYGLFRLDLSENLVSMPSTVWMSQAVLKEGKAVLPWSTPVQITGDDAYRVVVSPSALIFDTDDNGRVDKSSLSGKTATIRVYQGDKDVSEQFSKYDRHPSNYYNCNGSLKDLNKYPLEIQVTEIETQVVTDTAESESEISKTNGFLEFFLTNGSANVTAHVDVQVNVAKFTGQMVANNKKFETKFTQISTRFENTPTNKDLTEAESRITQTAREISLSVSEKSIGRRNLLVGSAFNRQEGFGLLLDANVRGYGILMNDGVDGMNCIKVASYYDGTRYQYCGAFWSGNYTKNIRIKHGTKYTFSCWVKVLDANTTVYLEVIYNRAEIGNDRDGRLTGPNSFAIKEPNKWQLVKWSFTTDDTHDWIEANVFTSSNVAYKTFVASFCKPMLAEGDYNGWTLSQEDYDYIGGNMIDNARTLEVGGSLKSLNTNGLPDYERAYYGDCMSLRIKSTNANTTYLVMEFATDAMELGVDYIFSFLAKGKANIGLYAQCDSNEEGDSVFSEDSVNQGTRLLNVRYASIIGIPNQLTTQYKRYWGHMRFRGHLPSKLYIQLNGAGEVYVCQPKLEKGATMTEWTERKTDLVDKASLKAAGILVDAESVTLYGNQVHIKKNKTDANDTVLIDNETGKVSAGLIDADKVVAKGIKTQELEAQHLKVTGNSQLGIFQIKTSLADGKRDNYTVDGDMITYSGSYKFPDGKTDLVSYDHFSYLTYKPLFIRQGAADSGKYMRLGNCYTEWDDCGYGPDNSSYLFNGASARYVCGGVTSECDKYVLPKNLTYNTTFFPVSYIYSTKSSKNDPAFAINVQSSGTEGERTAIQTNAAIRGVLAPNSMSISWSDTIPSGIGVVICTNGSEMTLTLPANPLEGQTLIIIQGSTSRVYIVPSGNEKIYCGGYTRDRNNKFYSGAIGQFNIFVFTNNNWQLQLINNKP